MGKITIETTKNHYETDANIAHYGEAVEKIGLWKSEKIIFEKHINKTDRILDLGCGCGRTTINLFKLGYEDIVGLDLSDRFVEFAKNYSREHNLAIEFMQGDARSLPFDGDSFDVAVFSFNGLMCIPEQKNRDKVLDEVRRVLKPGGKFIFTAHKRDENGKHAEFWAEQKTRFENGTQDPRLEKFGDRLYPEDTPDAVLNIIHIPSMDEVKEFLKRGNFEIMEHAYRPDFADESDAVREFSADTIFWIVRKQL
ncbi:MAG: class I SAM-dependent methyltransferase [Rickettsiales bacterium]|jgi:ubiquinone/menaquinone biosynthesis C-methylase UbiE|nr:class I SAM-dependent methyltransferase [Rickettsiales bacterium]